MHLIYDKPNRNTRIAKRQYEAKLTQVLNVQLVISAELYFLISIDEYATLLLFSHK